MSDRLEQTRQLVQELAALMKRHNALITLEPTTHTAQVVYLPEKIAQRSAESLEKRYMYNVIMEGEIGFSPELQEQLGLDEAITHVPEDQVADVRKFIEHIQYFGEDSATWLKDLGMDVGEEEE